MGIKEFRKKLRDIKDVGKAMKNAKIAENAVLKAMFELEHQLITIQENQVEFEVYLKRIEEKIK